MTEPRQVTVPLAGLPRPLPVEDVDPILAAAFRALGQAEPRQRTRAQGGGVAVTASLTGTQVVLLRQYLLRLPQPPTITTRRARAEAIDRLTGAMP